LEFARANSKWNNDIVGGRNPAITTWDVKIPVSNGINYLSTG